MNAHYYILFGGVALFAFMLNLPFGSLRSKVEKYSMKWFLYIHLPVPFVYVLRRAFSLRLSSIFFLIIASIAGQLLGGRILKKSDSSP